jgi:hypothetical protein
MKLREPPRESPCSVERSAGFQQLVDQSSHIVRSIVEVDADHAHLAGHCEVRQRIVDEDAFGGLGVCQRECMLEDRALVLG